MSPLTLAIEASNPSAYDGAGGVAIGRVGAHGCEELIGVEPFLAADRHTDDLMPAIDRLCTHAGVKPVQLDRVAVSVGPGGYTAVRIAVAVAASIAEAAGARCLAVPTECVAARGATLFPALVCLASKGETTWAAVVRTEGAVPEVVGLIDRAAVEHLAPCCVVADGFLPASIRGWIESAGLPIVAPLFEPEAVLDLSAACEPLDPGDLRPVYPREPEAVRRWRELHGA